MEHSVHNLFYVSPSDISGQELVVKGATFHHLIHVLRRGLHDQVVCTDGQGNRISAKIVKISQTKAEARIISKEHVDSSQACILDLAFAPLKGTRNELVLEKATELGVGHFRIFTSTFSVVRAPGKTKLHRFDNIIQSAMLQSMRYYLPSLSYHKGISDLISHFSAYDQVMVAEPGGDQGLPHSAQRLLFIVGPEGGFHGSEKTSMAQAGACFVSLGSHRLRSETAAIAGVAKILSAYKQL